jgi:hypothetical protein
MPDPRFEFTPQLLLLGQIRFPDTLLRVVVFHRMLTKLISIRESLTFAE